jgi:hypothetical protein
MLLKNYRKAKKGDTRCEKCEMSFYHPLAKRIRCGYDNLTLSITVGKNMTCDEASKKKEVTP